MCVRVRVDTKLNDVLSAGVRVSEFTCMCVCACESTCV